MSSYWQEAHLIKRLNFDIRWYQMGKINIVVSEGHMRREAIDIWSNLVQDVVDSHPKDEPAFILVDLSNPKQGFTPYSSHISRKLLNYVVENRTAVSYVGLILANNLIMQIINLFMQQILARTRYPSNSFTDAEAALNWMQEQVALEGVEQNT